MSFACPLRSSAGAFQMIDYNADKVITPISTDRTVFRELDQ